MRYQNKLSKGFFRQFILTAVLLSMIAISSVGHVSAVNGTGTMSHGMSSMKSSTPPQCQLLCGGMNFDKIKDFLLAPIQEVDPSPPNYAASAVMLSSYIAVIIGLYRAKKYLKVPIYEMNGLLRI